MLVSHQRDGTNMSFYKLGWDRETKYEDLLEDENKDKNQNKKIDYTNEISQILRNDMENETTGLPPSYNYAVDLTTPKSIRKMEKMAAARAQRIERKKGGSMWDLNEMDSIRKEEAFMANLAEHQKLLREKELKRGIRDQKIQTHLNPV